MTVDGDRLIILEQIELDLVKCVEAILEEARTRRPESASNLMIAAEHLNHAILEVGIRIENLRHPGAQGPPRG